MVESSTLQQSQTARDSFFSLPPLYALVIGINAYIDPRYPSLRSAVKDADDFNAYLTTKLQVPAERIINLRDTAATREAILQAFEDLRSLTSAHSSSFDNGRNGDIGIIVFFAGHGTRGMKPKEWEEDWATVGDYYEALCPSDMGLRRGSPSTGAVGWEADEVPAIPDRIIAALINRLSETRGNNIVRSPHPPDTVEHNTLTTLNQTLIFDCCHSAGASRTTDVEESEPSREGYVSRYIPSPPLLPHDYDREIMASLSRSTSGEGIARGFSGKNLSSHVLLAACGKEQFAHEHPKKPNGVFSYALMRVLDNPKIDIRSLTYTSLMSSIEYAQVVGPFSLLQSLLFTAIPRQNAHCQGAEVNRRLFNHRIQGGDPRFILGFKSKTGDLTLDAGTIQGITVGCKVAVYHSNLLPIPEQPNLSLGSLIVTAVDSASATLAFQPTPPTSSGPAPKPLTLSSLHPLFYCRISQRPSETLIISSNSISWLESALSPEFRASHSLTITTDTKAANLVFILEGDIVHLDHSFPLVDTHIGTRSPHTIPVGDIWLLRQVIQSVISFRFHLLRTNPDLPQKF
ncbi:hypothetical protein NP233_g12173 [Leucocoprinus birnbaumii]|uniref:Peptidase C14 caspase domain-containing protein n=1 Tax=Leucocoprinus birnbaumii TaxID=56174 RepID=A0AAD5VF29_9AGAR|nr:hypothetical protein NP233_g12173 [Leucocoprinus birnbaumii]